MKTLVLGAYGVMGQSVVRDIVKSDRVTTVVAADRDPDPVRLHPRLRDNPKLRAETLDIRDTERLGRLISEVDVVVSCVGPYYETALDIIPLAIDRGVHYVDICDDYDATIALCEAEELDQRAKKAGVTALYGMGSDPGNGNMIAKYAAMKLDTVEEMYFYWTVTVADPSGPALWEHVFHMNTGDIPVWLDGRRQWVPARSGRETVDFLPPFGPSPVHLVGHPEPITMPRMYPDLRVCVNKGGLAPDWAYEWMVSLAEFGFTSDEATTTGGQNVVPRKVTADLWQRAIGGLTRDQGEPTSAGKNVIKGTLDGQQVVLEYDQVGSMAPGTGIPASIAAQMIASGEVTTRGLVSPEQAIEPGPYFAEFAKRGAVVYEKQMRTVINGREG